MYEALAFISCKPTSKDLLATKNLRLSS